VSESRLSGMSGEGGPRRSSGAPPGRAAATEPFRGLGPTTISLLSLGAELNRLLDHLTRRRGSVTFSQYQLLALLRLTHPDPREPRELGRGLGSGSAQVTALLDSLERAGLLERRAHGGDRRRRWVHLTDEGVQTVEALAAQVRALEEHVFNHLGDVRRASALGQAAERLRAVISELTAADLSFALLAEPGRRPDGEEV
jgi:DNA-binding MarR family transcriptional regulator